MQDTNLPSLTPEQRAEALAKAAAARHARAELRDNIKAGKVTLADAAFIYDGTTLKNDKLTVDYTGADYAKKLTTAVETDEDDELVAGTDYDVVIKNAKDEVVTEAVDAGVYTFTITSKKYEIGSKVSFELTIDDAEVYAEFVSDIDYANYDGTVFYTGEEIDPIAAFWTDPNELANTTPVEKWATIDVPAAAYKVSIDAYTSEAGVAATVANMPTVVKEPGVYTLSIADVAGTDNHEIAGIYDGATNAATSFTLYVTSKGVYSDVPAGAWYAPYVYDVAAAGIMGGYGNGYLGPNDGAIRAQAAQMLKNFMEKTAK